MASPPSPTQSHPLIASCQRLRRAARLMPGPNGTLYAVIPHSDWIDLCNTLEELPRAQHNRERGNYFGGVRRRVRKQVVIDPAAQVATVTTVIEETHAAPVPPTEPPA